MSRPGIHPSTSGIRPEREQSQKQPYSRAQTQAAHLADDRMLALGHCCFTYCHSLSCRPRVTRTAPSNLVHLDAERLWTPPRTPAVVHDLVVQLVAVVGADSDTLRPSEPDRVVRVLELRNEERQRPRKLLLRHPRQPVLQNLLRSTSGELDGTKVTSKPTTAQSFTP
eukprot:227093-Rhodomonas_salina.3